MSTRFSQSGIATSQYPCESIHRASLSNKLDPEEPMTLCIAAPCKHESAPVLVLCADTRGTRGTGLVASEDTDKFRVIGNNTSVLIAGMVTKANELVNECEIAILPMLYNRVTPIDIDIHTTDVLQGLRRAVAKRRKELIEEHLILGIGMTKNEFLDVGRERFSKDHYDRIWGEIDSVNLGAEIILPLLTNEEAVIIIISASGQVLWADHYAAIGNGSNIAEVVLTQRDYDDEMSLMECLYRVYEAKIAAEKNPSVGPSTAFEVVTLDPAMSNGKVRYKSYDISDACFNYIDRKLRGRKLPKLEFRPEFLQSNDDESPGEESKPHSSELPPS